MKANNSTISYSTSVSCSPYKLFFSQNNPNVQIAQALREKYCDDFKNPQLRKSIYTTEGVFKQLIGSCDNLQNLTFEQIEFIEANSEKIHLLIGQGVNFADIKNKLFPKNYHSDFFRKIVKNANNIVCLIESLGEQRVNHLLQVVDNNLATLIIENAESYINFFKITFEQGLTNNQGFLRPEIDAIYQYNLFIESNFYSQFKIIIQNDWQKTLKLCKLFNTDINGLLKMNPVNLSTFYNNDIYYPNLQYLTNVFSVLELNIKPEDNNTKKSQKMTKIEDATNLPSKTWLDFFAYMGNRTTDSSSVKEIIKLTTEPYISARLNFLFEYKDILIRNGFSEHFLRDIFKYDKALTIPHGVFDGVLSTDINTPAYLFKLLPKFRVLLTKEEFDQDFNTTYVHFFKPENQRIGVILIRNFDLFYELKKTVPVEEIFKANPKHLLEYFNTQRKNKIEKAPQNRELSFRGLRDQEQDVCLSYRR
ncbi:MAG: hypothetical protein J0H68_03390 [Sphingobacteriia bacterium]|nr:hypothetical protein [Sphingobacteriia bacterium]